MDFRHLNFICNPNSLCLSAIETCFCFISSGASQCSMEVQWLHMLCEVNRKLQLKLNLVQQSGSHIFHPQCPSSSECPQCVSGHSGIFTRELGYCECTSIKTGLGDTLNGSESESRDKSFYSRHYNKKMKGGKRDGNTSRASGTNHVFYIAIDG